MNNNNNNNNNNNTNTSNREENDYHVLNINGTMEHCNGNGAIDKMAQSVECNKNVQKYYATEVQPDTFDPENHWYPKVLNAHIASQVHSFLSMGNERIVHRYCHLHPQVDADKLRSILSYEPMYFTWSGADLFNVTNIQGDRKMILIETNSCPSGMKSMPVLQENDEYGTYRVLIEKTFKPLVERHQREGRIPKEGRLAVVYDINEMEASGYAHTIASVFEEEVLLVEFYHTDEEPCVRFDDTGIMEVQDESGTWHKVRAAFRFLTQKPWTRIPISSKTVILNPIISCLAGGRNKLVADRAYEFFNSENEAHNLEVLVPKTIRDVERNLVPLYVKSFGGFAVIKNPYSNAGQGVWTITNEQDLERFMIDTVQGHQYDQFIVQSLVGNSKWSSSHQASGLQYFHVGTVPDRKHEIFVSDIRMMIHYDYERKGFAPLALYARRAKSPLAADPSNKNSWDMLGTNLSIKTKEDKWDTETKRLILMDRREFTRLGLGLDDLIDAYIQTVLATVAIDKIACRLSNEPGFFDMDMFSSLNNDPSLIEEIML